MRLYPLVLVLLAYSAIVQGQATVYKSVDEHGVVTFSDTPPADSSTAEQLQIDTPPPSSTGEYQQNLETMRETTDRMAADRREREKHRADMREAQARTNAYQQPQAYDRDYDDYDDYSYVTSYRNKPGRGHNRPGRPPWRPGHRPKPEHPIVRPPHRPTPNNKLTRPTDNNAQLMRPMTSRR